MLRCLLRRAVLRRVMRAFSDCLPRLPRRARCAPPRRLLSFLFNIRRFAGAADTAEFVRSDAGVRFSFLSAPIALSASSPPLIAAFFLQLQSADISSFAEIFSIIGLRRGQPFVMPRLTAAADIRFAAS